MSEEELTSKMEFIVDQQAQFAAKLGQLEDIVVRLANASLKRFEDLEDTTAEKLRDVDDRIAALVDSQMKLTEAQSRTDQSLRNLIAVADRYFSEGRNGEN